MRHLQKSMRQNDVQKANFDVGRSKISTFRVSSWREPYLDQSELTLWWASKSSVITVACRIPAASMKTKCPANPELIKYILIFQHKARDSWALAFHINTRQLVLLNLKDNLYSRHSQSLPVINLDWFGDKLCKKIFGPLLAHVWPLF